MSCNKYICAFKLALSCQELGAPMAATEETFWTKKWNERGRSHTSFQLYALLFLFIVIHRITPPPPWITPRRPKVKSRYVPMGANSIVYGMFSEHIDVLGTAKWRIIIWNLICMTCSIFVITVKILDDSVINIAWQRLETLILRYFRWMSTLFRHFYLTCLLAIPKKVIYVISFSFNASLVGVDQAVLSKLFFSWPWRRISPSKRIHFNPATLSDQL